jgi:hypothetical protein
MLTLVKLVILATSIHHRRFRVVVQFVRVLRLGSLAASAVVLGLLQCGVGVSGQERRRHLLSTHIKIIYTYINDRINE